ncbi:MAG: ABC transporter substrate-binding protein, partial [Clostridia bacterium]|nr:ABC transporter substrate-binding protein [Clostridia bacterium]
MSLRDAAGQMIENVNKSARRGQNINESYIDSLYDEVTALCRLDQITSTSLDPLPTESIILIAAIACC